jgi:hypothetical protein
MVVTYLDPVIERFLLFLWRIVESFEVFVNSVQLGHTGHAKLRNASLNNDGEFP